MTSTFTPSRCAEAGIVLLRRDALASKLRNTMRLVLRLRIRGLYLPQLLIQGFVFCGVVSLTSDPQIGHNSDASRKRAGNSRVGHVYLCFARSSRITYETNYLVLETLGDKKASDLLGRFILH